MFYAIMHNRFFAIIVGTLDVIDSCCVVFNEISYQINAYAAAVVGCVLTANVYYSLSTIIKLNTKHLLVYCPN